MEPEFVIADVVRRRAEAIAPGSPNMASVAVALAVRCYFNGASVAEACEEADRFLASWARHPSQQPVQRHLRAAS